jgi:hypothetical protein
MRKELKEKYYVVMCECIAKLEELVNFYTALPNTPKDQLESVAWSINRWIKEGKGYLKYEGVYKDGYEKPHFGFDGYIFRHLEDEWVYYFNDILSEEERIALNRIFDELRFILRKFFNLSLSH